MEIAVLEWYWLDKVCFAALFVMVFIGIYYSLLVWPRRRGRWPILTWNQWMKRKQYPAPWLRVLGIRTDAPSYEHKKQLLARSGFQIDPTGYEIIRRLLLSLASMGLGLGLVAWRLPVLTNWIQPMYIVLICSILLVLLGADHVMLESIGKRRAQLIMKEIYVLSNQLLYYNGSRQSLHHKLSRCIPFTQIIRSELQLLLNEWYAGAEQSIRRFKERLGTDEAYTFAETINSIRLYENDSYYELLRQRIQDYKEKLELAKDSRKETTSYVLFVIAGLPILNTFRIFIYPWVMEGQKLFQTLQ